MRTLGIRAAAKGVGGVTLNPYLMGHGLSEAPCFYQLAVEYEVAPE